MYIYIYLGCVLKNVLLLGLQNQKDLEINALWSPQKQRM